MRTVPRYFARRYLGYFVAILIAATLSISIVEMLAGNDEAFGTGAGGTDLLRLVLVRVPSLYLGELIPLSAFLAAFLSLGLAAQWLEIIALRAGGISPHQAAWPVLLVALLLAGATHWLDESLVTRSRQGLETSRQTSDRELVFRRGAFWYHSGRTLYNIRASDRETSTLRGVTILERSRRGRLERSIVAPVVHVADDGRWILEDATVERFDPAHVESPVDVQRGVRLELRIDQDRDSLLRQTDAGALPIAELSRYLERHRSDDTPGARANWQRLHTALHQRLAAPVLVLLFTLLAIPIGLRVRPGGSLGRAALGAVVVLAAFYLVRGAGATLAGSGMVSGMLVVWSTIASFALYGVVALARVPR